MNPDPTPNHPQGNSRPGNRKNWLLLIGLIVVLGKGAWLYFEYKDGQEPPPIGKMSQWQDLPTTTIKTPKPTKSLDVNPPSEVPALYNLDVKNGSGSGKYSAGARIRISAKPPAPDETFLNWTTDNGGSFREKANKETSFTMPANAVIVTANYRPVDEAFSGQYSSGRKKSKYEIDSEKRRFGFYTLIEGRFLLQTEIAPYQVRRFEGPETAIEISGADNQAGGGPMTVVRVTKIAENDFKLERIKPIGGDLGIFHTQSP